MFFGSWKAVKRFFGPWNVWAICSAFISNKTWGGAFLSPRLTTAGGALMRSKYCRDHFPSSAIWSAIIFAFFTSKLGDLTGLHSRNMKILTGLSWHFFLAHLLTYLIISASSNHSDINSDRSSDTDISDLANFILSYDIYADSWSDKLYVTYFGILTYILHIVLLYDSYIVICNCMCIFYHILTFTPSNIIPKTGSLGDRGPVGHTCGEEEMTENLETLSW